MKKLDDGSLYLSKEDIFEYLKNRPPLLMIEEARVIAGKEAISERVLREDEWFFACHFPGNPMMPGVLQLEAIFNTAALAIKTLDTNKDKTTNIANVSNVKYKRHILPLEKITIKTYVEKYRRGLAFMKGEIDSNGELCCEASFTLVILDEILAVR